MTSSEARLAVIGAGRMGGAMLRSWAANVPGLKASEILVIDPDRGARDRAEDVGARTVGHAEKEMLVGLDTVVIAIKPQLFDAVAPSLAPLLPAGVLLISIAAGVTIAKLKEHFPRACVVRSMPNRPAEIGQGATAFVCHPSVTEAQRERAHALLAAGGVVVEVEDEALMDVVTALSGSGPAYVFALVEAMAAAAVAEGLPHDMAVALARATVAGAGAMLAEDGADAGALRESVTSPGGTTEAALGVLRAPDGLNALLGKAIAAAVRRGKELGGVEEELSG